MFSLLYKFFPVLQASILQLSIIQFLLPLPMLRLLQDGSLPQSRQEARALRDAPASLLMPLFWLLALHSSPMYKTFLSDQFSFYPGRTFTFNLGACRCSIALCNNRRTYIPVTLCNNMRQLFTTKCDSPLLQSVTAILLQSMAGVIAKNDSYFKVRRFYDKVRQILQIVKINTKCDLQSL